MKILAVETSCDETALALVEASGGLTRPRFKVLGSVVASQIQTHRPWGGVVPTLAKREHEKNLPIAFEDLKRACGKKIDAIDLIAVTVGPGLEPCLWTGINFANELAKNYKKLLIGASHLEGHLLSALLAKGADPKILFPSVALIVSGGHTILLHMKSLISWKKIGETRDDAAGEAFDKVAKMMKLPYPGGPEIEQLAHLGDPNAIPFPRPMLHHKNFDFSFSGLKTAVLYKLREFKKIDKKIKADVAASFQQAVIDVLMQKTMRATRELNARSILLSGGVAANTTLRKALQAAARKAKLKFIVPEFRYNTDNAVMIATAAYIGYLTDTKRKIIAQSNLNF